MPPDGHRISPAEVAQLHSNASLGGPGTTQTGFLTAIGRSCTPENTLLLSVR